MLETKPWNWLLFCIMAMMPAHVVARDGYAEMHSPLPFEKCIEDERQAGVAPSAEQSDDTTPADALVTELLSWIGQNSDYEVSAILEKPPAISFCNVGERIEYEGREVVVDPHMRAAYDLDAHRISLVRPWHLSDALDRSGLLHELVHAVQFNTREWVCDEAAEWDAYKLQERWLRDQGFDPTFDWLKIGLISKCWRDIHP